MSGVSVLGEIEFVEGQRFLIDAMLETTDAFIRVHGCFTGARKGPRREWTFTWHRIDWIEWRVSVFPGPGPDLGTRAAAA